MAISKADIEHLKDLARVEFNEKETEKLAQDLRDILRYVDALKEADVSGVSEMTRASEEAKNIFRKDDIGAKEAPDKYAIAKELINSFPDKQDAGHGIYLKVKAIL